MGVGSAWPQTKDPIQIGVAALERGHYATALRAWLPLANGGNAQAQTNVGYMHERGFGVPQSYVEAIRWYRLAAAQGLAEAQYNLGTLYYYGYGVKANSVEAVDWFRRAAKQRLPEAEYMLGMAYVKGVGAPRSETEGLMWLLRSAQQGYLSAQLMAAQTYLAIQRPDPFKAYVWSDIAAQRGNQDASLVRDYASFTLERDQIALAAEAAKRCQSTDYQDCPTD